jgi:hypothetical protein
MIKTTGPFVLASLRASRRVGGFDTYLLILKYPAPLSPSQGMCLGLFFNYFIKNFKRSLGLSCAATASRECVIPQVFNVVIRA